MIRPENITAYVSGTDWVTVLDGPQTPGETIQIVTLSAYNPGSSLTVYFRFVRGKNMARIASDTIAAEGYFVNGRRFLTGPDQRIEASLSAVATTAVEIDCHYTIDDTLALPSS